MTKSTAPRISVRTDDLNVCCGVGMDEIHIVRPPFGEGSFAQTLTIANRTDAIRMALEELRARAGAVRFAQLRIVAEPAGIYHQLLMRIARSIGFRTALVNAEHVVKMRSVVFGDDGKTDARDP